MSVVSVYRRVAFAALLPLSIGGLVVGVATRAHAQVRTDVIYVSTRNNARFGYFDPANGFAYTQISQNGLPLFGLAFTNDGTLYGTTNAQFVARINPVTGGGTLIGQSNPALANMAAVDGTLYGLSIPLTTQAVTTYSVNGPTGTATQLGTGGGSNAFSIAGMGGTLYALSVPNNNQALAPTFGTINTTTGAFTGIGTALLGLSNVVAFNGTLYAFRDTNANNIFRIDPATGNATQVGSYDALTNGFIYDAVQGQSAVVSSAAPEPGALSLVLLGGLVGFVQFRKIRKNG